MKHMLTAHPPGEIIVRYLSMGAHVHAHTREFMRARVCVPYIVRVHT